MYNIKFYYDDEEIDRFIELKNVTFPTQFTDVMDGTWDTGSLEFIMNINEFNSIKSKLQEGNYIKREIIKDNELIDETAFEIEELNVEKDSVYDNQEIKITIKYVESTKFLTNLMMPNHTFSIYNYYIENTKETTNTTLYDVLVRSTKIIQERNNLEYTGSTEAYPFFVVGSRFRKMNVDTINPDLVKILKSYPSKNRTYIDSNYFDICKENFNDISAVPYYNALRTELDYISSMGKETNKEINFDEDKIVVSSSYNRSLSNNVDMIENKAVNIYQDSESIWYPLNIPLDNYINNQSVISNPGNYTRPKGLNEGLEQYQYWYDWYLELPFNIERIEKLYLLKINKEFEQGSDVTIIGSNDFVDVSSRIVEDSVYQGLTPTEKKYFAHYKRGSNRIENVVITAGITTEDDNWPWEKAKDNAVAFKTAFAVKYKPIINTDIIVAKSPKKIKNKKNIVIANKNISDSDLTSQTRYELEKNFYSQYMLEIAGDYQPIFAGELVNINGFENYNIPSRKYLIYKVDTTFDKEGSHQIIYFNEVVGKNNVLLNENNIVRISQNPSYDSVIDRVFKYTNLVHISGGLTTDIENNRNTLSSSHSELIFSNFMMILAPKLLDEITSFNITPIKNINGISLKVKNYMLANNNFVPDDSDPDDPDGPLSGDDYKISKFVKYLVPTMNFFNSGSVSQVIIKAINNYIWDNKGSSTKYAIKGGNGTLTKSEPVRYSDSTGYVYSFEMSIRNEKPTSYLNGESSGLSLDANYNTYYPEDTSGIYYKNSEKSGSSIYFGEKDQRETFVGVYEQTFTSIDNTENKDNVKIDLTDYFTSCTSCFMHEISTNDINIGHKLDKDILIFDKKIYNINSINESLAVKTIEASNYYDVVSVDNYNNLYIKLTDPETNLPFVGKVGQEIDEYSFVIRGVLNTIVINGVNTFIKKVPQIVITVPKHIVKENEHIKLDLSAIRL